MHRTINFVAFYVGWFACVAGAGRGLPWLGPSVVAVLVAFHFLALPAARHEGRVLLTAAAIGVLVEGLHLRLATLALPGADPFPVLPPLWLVALWILFATTLNHSLSWMRGRYPLAALFGAVGGPLSYAAGVRLGAAEFPNTAFSIAVIAAVWAVAMPALLWANERACRRPAAPQQAPPVAGALSSAPAPTGAGRVSR